MARFTRALLGIVLLGPSLAPAADADWPQQRQASSRSTPPGSRAADTLPPASQNALIAKYCVTCHNDRLRTANLTLAAFDAGRAELQAEVAEKMIRKLRAGMMPPPGVRRPEAAALSALAVSLETRIDSEAAARPEPGWRPFQRLNRAEYARAVYDLLGLEVDAAVFLPPDTVSDGFDNVADVQAFSATLMDGYLRAANRISREALGDPSAGASEATYRVERTASQLTHVEGAPIGTRGGISVVYNFPADGEYMFKILLHGSPTGLLFGSTTRGEQVEVSVNGHTVAVLDINPRMTESQPEGLNLQTPPLIVKAGQQRVTAAFIQRSEGPVDDLMAPIDHTLADTQIGQSDGVGMTTLPHLRHLVISGPYNVTGVSDTAVRGRILRCRPTSVSEERPCAKVIVSHLAAQAYRRPLNARGVDALMHFYEEGRRDGDFESGIRMALQAILASPHFLFRLERAPAGARPGRIYRVGDVELASRLSFFIWGSVPDRELVATAMRGGLRNAATLETQVRRMLADPRAEALATRFAAQWLRLQDLNLIRPDALLYPYYDATLAQAMRRETELFFDHLVREDRSVSDLLTADHTFVNERLAKHYGIPNVTGNAFRRVAIPDENRRGLLGHGSILTLTSHADRTSPVIRGKWVMQVLLGTPPPPPPPNVPELKRAEAPDEGRLLSVRERLEAHRANPACSSCHRVIDPLGLALENFDVTGAWRIRDNGVPIDASGQLYDGTRLDGPVGLRRALLGRSDVFLLTFTENLMMYGLGRRVEHFDMPTVRAIIREAEPNDYRMSSFVLGVVKSAAFQLSKVEDTPHAAAARPEGH